VPWKKNKEKVHQKKKVSRERGMKENDHPRNLWGKKKSEQKIEGQKNRFKE